jgi:hypothetical protein
MNNQNQRPKRENNSVETKGDTDMPDATKKGQKSDDNVESSSSGSDGGKGSGSGGSGGGYSGGGYSADCSSSDASSTEAVKGNTPDKEMHHLTISEEKTSTKEEIMPSKTATAKAQNANTDEKQSKSTNKKYSTNESNGNEEKAENDAGTNYSAPQWNGVRIQHPMDPRIDLSTVGHIQTSSLSISFPNNADIPNQQKPNQQSNPIDSSEPPAPPSIDQYMTLMEVRRSC